MSYCFNPHCLEPQNPLAAKFCLNCQTPLLLERRYRAIEIIGRGGMGRTLLATNEKVRGAESTCVIKQFFPQTRNITSRQKAIELFAAEAVILDELGRHPQIPQLYDYFTQNEHQYLVQEWIEGDNLTQVLQKQGTFDEKRICQLLNALLPVLAFVHQHQIIHRDIKPENILSCSDGTLVLVDFGAAKAVSARALDRTGTIIGSPEYIAPEQLRGKAVISSDIYSLGVTCLHLLTGISPFDLYSDSEDAWVWQDYLASNSISEELGQILDKMIIRAISQRYQSASAVLGDLNANCVYSLELASNCPEKAFEFVPAEPKIDYTPLRDLLATKQWQQANQITERLLLQAAHEERKDWLERDDLENLSCEVLWAIDRLWSDYSQKHFGFSVQYGIWQNLDPKNYRNFGKQVGWYLEARWILTKQIDFSLAAPKGHLPAMSWWFGHAIWGLKGLFLKLDACLTQKIVPSEDNDKNQIIL
ncbi:protein kinase domain-containing protein [Myxosarcina sp. GI1(2024)]